LEWLALDARSGRLLRANTPPFLVLPNGETMEERIIPELKEVARTGDLPPMIALGSRTGS